MAPKKPPVQAHQLLCGLTACWITKLLYATPSAELTAVLDGFGMLYGPLWRPSLLALSDLARRSP